MNYFGSLAQIKMLVKDLRKDFYEVIQNQVKRPFQHHKMEYLVPKVLTQNEMNDKKPCQQMSKVVLGNRCPRTTRTTHQ